MTEQERTVQTMRDRLIELLTDNLPRCGSLPHWDNPLQLSCDEQVERIADHLLANGVILPPCKVGDTVYVINEWEVEKTTVFSMKIESQDSRWVTFLKANVADHGIKFKDGYGSMFKTFVFGKTVFLTKEEAEQALKECEKV